VGAGLEGYRRYMAEVDPPKSTADLNIDSKIYPLHAEEVLLLW
jgi:hypothetical protein